jgi:HK97 family phage major capsid protein
MPEAITDVKAALDEMGKLAVSFHDVAKRQNEAVAKIGTDVSTYKEELEKMNKRADLLEAAIWSPTKALGLLNGTMDSNDYKDMWRRGCDTTGTVKRSEKGHKHMDLFIKYCRSEKAIGGLGEEGYVTAVKSLYSEAGPEVAKTLTVGDDAAGGFLAPPEYVKEIIKAIVLISPMRSIARIRTTANKSVIIPKRVSTFAAQWDNEVATQPESTGLRYGDEEIMTQRLGAQHQVSLEAMEDAEFDLASELNSEFSEQFARAEGTAFVNGTGNMQPEGVMTNTAIASDVTTSAAALTYGGFVTCAHNLKSDYAKNATWIMNRQTVGSVRSIVDGNSRPIWFQYASSGLDLNNPPTILGIPYMEFPDMPAVGASTYPVALGDFKRGYLIVDRIQLQVMRDPYTQLSRAMVRFVARKRVNGQVILAEAIRKLQCHS